MHPRTTRVRLSPLSLRRQVITFRTLRPPVRRVAEGVRPPFTLDGLVSVTVSAVVSCPWERLER